MDSSKEKSQKKGRADFNKQEQRDREILFFLYCGIGQSSQIRNELFRGEDGNLLHKRTIQRRLNFLLKESYVKRTSYKSIRGRKGPYIYALDERGVYEVCNHFCLNSERARNSFPAKKHIAHEVVLSSAIRILFREANMGRYKIDHVYDDREMKSIMPAKRGIYYPDAHITVISRTGNSLTFHIELDAGNRGPSYWKDKITSWNDPTLVLAFNHNRLDLLRQYVSNFKHHQILAFALASEFTRKGLSETEWLWHPKGNIAKIDLR